MNANDQHFIKWLADNFGFSVGRYPADPRQLILAVPEDKFSEFASWCRKTSARAREADEWKEKYEKALIDLSGAQREIGELKSNIEDLEKGLYQCNLDLTEASRKNKTLSDQVTELENKVGRLEQKIRICDELRRRINNLHQQTILRQSECWDRMKEPEQKLQDLDSEIKRLEDHAQQLRDFLSILRGYSKDLENLGLCSEQASAVEDTIRGAESGLGSVSDKVLQKLRDERECWRKRFTAVKDDCMKWDEMPSELTELLQLVSQDAATATEGATGSECDLGRSRGHDVTSAGGREDFSWIGGVAAAGAESSSPATSLEATLRERQISRTSDISGDTSPALSAEIAAMTESDLDKLLADEPLSPDEEPPDDSMPELLVAGSFSDVTVSLRPEPETVRHERLVHPSDESPTPSPGQLGLLRHEVTGLLSDDVDSVSVEKKEP